MISLYKHYVDRRSELSDQINNSAVLPNELLDGFTKAARSWAISHKTGYRSVHDAVVRDTYPKDKRQMKS